MRSYSPQPEEPTIDEPMRRILGVVEFDCGTQCESPKQVSESAARKSSSFFRTAVMIDIRPGINSSFPDQLTDVDGTLMTEITKSGGRATGSPLYSETVITDGNWHRIGFVWDGSERILYVDDIPAALDGLGSLDSAKGGLVIGVGTGNQAGSFWSGMIDDVQIYDRAVMP